jgi:uncharacterized membrane protein
MGCYCHLTREDREEIAVLRAAGHSMRAVAAAAPLFSVSVASFPMILDREIDVVIMFPGLGHATWHLYRKALAPKLTPGSP